MTSSGSTPTKCPPKNTGLLPRDIFKDPSIDHTIRKGLILKDILVVANISKRLLHVDGSCVGLHVVVTIVYFSRSPTPTQWRFSFCAGLQFSRDSIRTPSCVHRSRNRRKWRAVNNLITTLTNITCALIKTSAAEHGIIALIILNVSRDRIFPAKTGEYPRLLKTGSL